MTGKELIKLIEDNGLGEAKILVSVPKDISHGESFPRYHSFEIERLVGLTYSQEVALLGVLEE
jgi:hypothetical protein